MASTSMLTPRVSERRTNSWRRSSQVCPTRVRNWMACHHSASVGSTSWTKACRWRTRLVKTALVRGSEVASRLRRTRCVISASAVSRVALLGVTGAEVSTDAPLGQEGVGVGTDTLSAVFDAPFFGVHLGDDGARERAGGIPAAGAVLWDVAVHLGERHRADPAVSDGGVLAGREAGGPVSEPGIAVSRDCDRGGIHRGDSGAG